MIRPPSSNSQGDLFVIQQAGAALLTMFLCRPRGMAQAISVPDMAVYNRAVAPALSKHHHHDEHCDLPLDGLRVAQLTGTPAAS
jgi:hypothetical protein